MKQPNANYYIDGVLSGNRLILSKTITLIESSLHLHKEIAKEVINKLLPHTGKSIRIGLTGVPGAGKSTFTETFGLMLTKELNKKVAVMAIDPSSRRSGGSILGDKTRMERLAIEENAYIRPSPAGDTLGGVAKTTRETMLLCEAAGFDVIIIETVGVGQSETTVASMVDFFLLLMISGAGDELQGLKKGVIEIADAIVVNKADGDNIQRALIARKEYETALHFLKPISNNWSPPALTCSALEGTGVKEVWEMILSYKNILSKSGEFYTKRKEQAIDWMHFLIDEGLKNRFYKTEIINKALLKHIKDIEVGAISATVAAEEVLNLFDNKKNNKKEKNESNCNKW